MFQDRTFGGSLEAWLAGSALCDIGKILEGLESPFPT